MDSAVKLAIIGLFLGSLASAQVPTQSASSASSAVVLPTPGANVKPDKATISDSSADAEIVADPASLLPDLPPIPQAKATLVGGTVERLDRVRDQMTVRVFGGGRINVLFDPRTSVYQQGKDGSIGDLREGERVYVDTILDGSTVFAQSIRVKVDRAVGESQGLVLKYRADRGEVTIRDLISPEPVRVRVNSSTQLLQGNRPVPMSTLTNGSLIAVKFSSAGDGTDLAREISILALPGTRYIFAGQVVHLDLRTGLLVLYSTTDRKTYEIYLNPSLAPDDNLQNGATVTVITTLENSRYVAHGLSIDSLSK